MYMPRISPSWTASRISVTVRPFSPDQSPEPQTARKARADRVVGDGLVIGQEHRDQAGIRRALHVVLAAQRVQPGARPADMAAHQRERDQAAGIVGAVDMLGNAHAPEDHPGAAAAKSRATARRVSAGMPQTASIFSGAKSARWARHRLPVLGHRLDVLAVVEPLLDDHVHDRVEHRHVGAGLELQHVGGVAAQRLAARVHDDQLAAALGELLEDRWRRRGGSRSGWRR
jgi:hypothetical protein